MMTRNMKAALFIFALIAVISGSWLFMNRQHTDYWETGHMMGYSNWWIMMIFMILFWGLVIWGIFWLVKSLGRSDQDVPTNEHLSAIEVLRRRYAAGEISREEFEVKRSDISLK